MICFDTQILIWGVQGVSTSGQEAMILLAKNYIRHLSEQKEPVMVPSPAMFEYLAGFDDKERRERSAEILTREFFVAPFDFKAANLAAGILAGTENWKRLAKETGTPRELIKIDAQILATAVAAGVSKIICHDEAMKKLASKLPIQAIEIPAIQEQTTMF